MKYKVIKSDNKSPDWKVCTLERIDGTILNDATINRNDKKGALFPNFDALLVGYEFEGNEWASSGGRTYVFPPKTASGRTFTPKPKTDYLEVEKLRQQGFKEGADRKEIGISYHAALETARMIVSALIQSGIIKPTLEETRHLIEQERDHWLEQWDAYNNPKADY